MWEAASKAGLVVVIMCLVGLLVVDAKKTCPKGTASIPEAGNGTDAIQKQSYSKKSSVRVIMDLPEAKHYQAM